MGKLITYEDFKKRRELKPLPVVNHNEAHQGAQIFPFSMATNTTGRRRTRLGKLRVQMKELRKALIYIGLRPYKENMIFFICFTSDMEEAHLFAEVDQYRHLKDYLMRSGPSILPKYREFAAAMGQLGILLPNFVCGALVPTAPHGPPDDIA